MGRKRDPRRVKGAPGLARALRAQREVERKLVGVRQCVHRVRALGRRGYGRGGGEGQDAALQQEADACFAEIRALAVAPRGLASNELRRELWSFVLGLGEEGDTGGRRRSESESHRDAYQVDKDIDRSLWHFDVVRGIKESERRSKRRALTDIILSTLSENIDLHYYQGYHDICSVFLLVFGDPHAAGRAMGAVSRSYHREPMRENFAVVMQTTRLLFPLLDAADEQLFGSMQATNVEPFFALPWIITWFAHQLTRFEDAARLFDVFLVSHPLFSLYVSAAVVLEARQQVLQCDCDFGTMHGLLSKLPLTMDLEAVVARAVTLLHQLPPTALLEKYEARSTLESAMYFKFPFAFQTWESVASPILSNVPPLPPRASSDMGKAGAWVAAIRTSKHSLITAAAGIGLLAVIAAYVWRSRPAAGTWLLEQ